MTDMLSMPFEYRKRPYTAIITIKKASDHTEYRVTIMNGELEKLLFGHHIIVEKNGRFLADEGFQNSDIKQLKQAILEALTSHCDKWIGHKKQRTY